MVNLNMADEIAVVARWAISSRFLLLFSQVGAKKIKQMGKISAQPHTSLYIHIWGFIIQCITSKMYMHN